MRRELSFYWRCLCIAVRDNTSFANDWQWIIGAPAIGLCAPAVLKALSVDTLTTTYPVADAFGGAFILFATTWAAAVAWKFFKAIPAEYFRVDAAFEALQEKQKPVLSLRFNPTAECVHNPVPGYRHARVVAFNDSDEELEECWALMERVERWSGDHWEPLLQFSPVHVAWSGVIPTAAEKHARISLPPRIRRPIDVLKAWTESQNRTWLEVENPGWARGWLRSPNRFRFRIIARGKGAKEAEILICAEWTGTPDTMEVWQDSQAQPRERLSLPGS